MRKSYLLAVLAAGVLSIALAGYYAIAQQPARPPAMRPPQRGPIVALLDVSRVFKQHARFKSMMADMKKDVQRAEGEVRAGRDAVRKLMERLARFKGTPDYNAEEEDITRRLSDLNVRVKLTRREFLQREAKIYHNVYQEILQEVNYYCTSQKVDMVLRFNGDRVDPENAESVLKGINKPVIWYAGNLDITDIVLSEMNRRAATAGSPRTGEKPTRPAHGVGTYQR